MATLTPNSQCCDLVKGEGGQHDASTDQRRIGGRFARAEGAAFVNGTGTNQPKGFLAAPKSLDGDGARAFGTLQYMASGDADGFDEEPDVKLIDLIHTLKAGHRQGASWVMNSSTLAEVRKRGPRASNTTRPVSPTGSRGS